MPNNINWIQVIFFLLIFGGGALQWAYRQLKEQRAKRQIILERERRAAEMLRTGRVEATASTQATSGPTNLEIVAARRQQQLEELRRRQQAARRGNAPGTPPARPMPSAGQRPGGQTGQQGGQMGGSRPQPRPIPGTATGGRAPTVAQPTQRPSEQVPMGHRPGTLEPRTNRSETSAGATRQEQYASGQAGRPYASNQKEQQAARRQQTARQDAAVDAAMRRMRAAEQAGLDPALVDDLAARFAKLDIAQNSRDAAQSAGDALLVAGTVSDRKLGVAMPTTRQGWRQAIVLNEILMPPKCLRQEG
jgi:hypothetical protein